MASEWIPTMKPSFLAELKALPPAETGNVLEKVGSLLVDPTPSGKNKKRLKGWKTPMFRIRAGNYRIFYTFKEPHVSLLALRKRDDATYDDEVEGEDLGGLDVEPERDERREPDWERMFLDPKQKSRPLQKPLTDDLLRRLRVPEAAWPRLLLVTNRDELLDCPGLPDELLLEIDAALFERPLVEVLEEKELIARGVDDLLEFKEGNLLSFLLRLDPDQEEIVGRALDAKGPVLVKGGPGSGKSTVALYRVKALLDRLPDNPAPRILFTTYTNALTRSSEQLLKQLLGERAKHVEVRTADSVARGIAALAGHDASMLSGSEWTKLVLQATDSTTFEGNALQVAAQQKTLERLGPEYLAQELAKVIEGRGLETLESYEVAARPGRLVPLNATQRRAVWTVGQRVRELLRERSEWSWEQLRALAARLVAEGKGPDPYDAVLVDEAQDLDPVALRMLTGLCKSPGRLFVTADANQSLYGAGFRWTDVHESLHFTGRTSRLRANHRSTEEIGEAANRWLADAGLESTDTDTRYSHHGPRPVARSVATEDDGTELLARFLLGAPREFRLGLGSCAVLVPNERAGRTLAAGLSARNVAVEFMAGRNLDLESQNAKIITLKSAKGLEFPIVALAGFPKRDWPTLPKDLPEEARGELIDQERRTLYVAMTRAMRALLLVVPTGTKSPLLTGFDETLWNLG